MLLSRTAPNRANRSPITALWTTLSGFESLPPSHFDSPLACDDDGERRVARAGDPTRLTRRLRPQGDEAVASSLRRGLDDYRGRGTNAALDGQPVDRVRPFVAKGVTNTVARLVARS